jgi:hypothetical protein
MMNNADAFGMLILRPHDKITVSSEFHSLRLANANDTWFIGDGVYEPWTFGYSARSSSGARYLANLCDTNPEFRASRNLTLTACFGYAQGLSVIEQIYGSGRATHLGYLEALWRLLCARTQSCAYSKRSNDPESGETGVTDRGFLLPADPVRQNAQYAGSRSGGQ